MNVKAMSKKVLVVFAILLAMGIVVDVGFSIANKTEMQTVRTVRIFLSDLGFKPEVKASQPIVRSSSQSTSYSSEESLNKQSFVSVPISSVSATSWIVGSKEPDKYIPEKMIDGDEKTSFQFSTKTISLNNEYIYIDLSKAADLGELWIKNGNWNISNGKESYTLNCRIKKMKVGFKYSSSNSYEDEMEFTIPDDTKRTNWTVLDLGVKKKVISIRIVVTEIYKGTKYPHDVCISEIQLLGIVSNNSSTRTVFPSKAYSDTNGSFIQCMPIPLDTTFSTVRIKGVLPL